MLTGHKATTGAFPPKLTRTRGGNCRSPNPRDQRVEAQVLMRSSFNADSNLTVGALRRGMPSAVGRCEAIAASHHLNNDLARPNNREYVDRSASSGKRGLSSGHGLFLLCTGRRPEANHYNLLRIADALAVDDA